MAESSFYISDMDRKGLCDYLLQMDYHIIPNAQYSTYEFTEVKSSDEFIQIIENQTVSFFITHADSQKEPLVISQNPFMDVPTFAIDQRTGGPYIAISLYRGFSSDSKIKYKSTDIFHYSKYIQFNGSTEFAASEELKFHYKSIIKYLKSRCSRIEKASKYYWVSKLVLEQNISL